MQKTPQFKTLIKGKKAVAAVIPHTHWDRAWYHPFEQFRLSLCKITRRLLSILESDRLYASFTFDGQAVVLEDYLEIFPEDRARIERLVKAGRITFGPFYVLPDMFLITGESLIRNGLIGQAFAESFGRSSRQGYVADPFGLSSQLPQIFSGLGIESVFFSRGMSKEQVRRAGAMFWWLGPDGKTRILGILQVNGYSNMHNWGVPLGEYPREDPDTGDIDFAYSEKQVRDLLEAYRKFGVRSRVLFFGNGVDHHGPQHKLPELLRYNAARFKDLEFVITDTDGMVRLVKQEEPNLRTISGELHQQGVWPTLNGTLDSRFYLKQQYDDAAAWLECRAEPLCALAAHLKLDERLLRETQHAGYAFNVGNDAAYSGYPAGSLRYAWKILLRNAPHDDICGCSIDPTHRDAENRAKRVIEIGSLLASDAALRLAHSVPAVGCAARIFAWNPLGHPYTAALQAKMLVPANSIRFRLLDPNGREIPASISARVTAPHFRRWHSEDFRELPQKAVEVTAAFSARLPAIGYAVFALQELPSKARQPVLVKRLASGMENSFVRVRLRADGSFDLFDKRTRVWYRHQHKLRDHGDAGDLYTSKILPGACRAAAKRGCVRCIASLGDRVVFEVKAELPAVPNGLSADRSRRGAEKRPIAITFHFSLFAHSPVLRIRAEWRNQHHEHRLTVDFPTGLRTAKTEAGSILDVVPHNAPFLQESCRDFVTAASGGRRVTLLSRSMHSYDARLERGGLVLSKCLLKANGLVNASLRPYWPAPEGNCERPVIQEYAFFSGRGNDAWDQLSRAAGEFCRGPYVEYYLDPPGGGKKLPAEHSFIELSAPFELSALKQREEGNSLILRIANMSSSRVAGVITLSPLLKAHRVWRTDMRERRLSALAISQNKIAIQARSREIVTVELES